MSRFRPRTLMGALTLTLLALASPVAMAQSKPWQMRVEPATIQVGQGQQQLLKLSYAPRGGQWQVARADEWHVLVKPSTLGQVGQSAQGLVFQGTTKGAGELHIWAKDQRSWLGLYQIIKVTVTEPAPTPPPVRRGGELRVFRLDGGTPRQLGDRNMVAGGSTVELQAYYSGRRGTRAATVQYALPRGAAARILSQDGNRAIVQFAAVTSMTPLELTLVSRRGTRTTCPLVIIPPRGKVESIDVWCKVGLKGAWTLLGQRPLEVRPGQALFLLAAGNSSSRRWGSSFTPGWALQATRGTELIPMTAQMTALVIGFGEAQARATVTVTEDGVRREVQFVQQK